jgi:ATP-dependent helicase/nuclease subunit B
VVLPGLDHDLDDAGWAAIGMPGEAPVPSHPQYGLKLLLAALGATRGDVAVLPGFRPTPRARLIGMAMRAAETTDAWAGTTVDAAALDGLGIVIAANEQEEALAIAVSPRRTSRVSRGAGDARLTIARRVAELSRFGLPIDDSAGIALRDTPPAVLARLTVDAALSDADPVALLALAKHPLAGFGMAAAECRHAARSLELALLRNPRLAGGVADLPAELEAALAVVQEGQGRVPVSRKRLRHSDWAAAALLASRMSAAFAPLEAARSAAALSVAEATRLLIDTLLVAVDDTARCRTLEIRQRRRAWIDERFHPRQAISRLHRRLSRFSPRRKAWGHATPTADPRIHIWVTLEARLQSADLTILAGLDEGVWPAATRTDPWLSRTMRARIGLEAPERRIGLAAHDFAQAMASRRVLVTRAEKRGGAPTVASRWLQRLGAVVGEGGMKTLAGAGETYLAIARAIDRNPGGEQREPRPEPQAAMRPRSLPITGNRDLARSRHLCRHPQPGTAGRHRPTARRPPARHARSCGARHVRGRMARTVRRRGGATAAGNRRRRLHGGRAFSRSARDLVAAFPGDRALAYRLGGGAERGCCRPVRGSERPDGIRRAAWAIRAPRPRRPH